MAYEVIGNADIFSPLSDAERDQAAKAIEKALGDRLWPDRRYAYHELWNEFPDILGRRMTTHAACNMINDILDYYY